MSETPALIEDDQKELGKALKVLVARIGVKRAAAVFVGAIENGGSILEAVRKEIELARPEPVLLGGTPFQRLIVGLAGIVSAESIGMPPRVERSLPAERTWDLLSPSQLEMAARFRSPAPSPSAREERKPRRSLAERKARRAKRKQRGKR